MLSFQFNFYSKPGKKTFFVYKLIAIIAFIATLLTAFNTADFLSKSEKIRGKVIENMAEKNDEGQTMYRPVFAFQSPTGETLRFKSGFSSSSATYALDDEVELYVTFNPLKVMLDSFFQKWFIPLFLSIFWITFGSIGFWPSLKNLFTKKRELLKQTGLQTIAKDLRVEESALKINGQRGFHITAQGINPVTQKHMTFRSPRLDEVPHFSEKAVVAIYVDPHKATTYYMDLDSLTHTDEPTQPSVIQKM